MTNYEITKGEIEMTNFSVPFDFDGDRFLFLENMEICLMQN